mmetsp:Transcript_10648/g.15832  ORF Transcript_10648/g.15832 Transcript_10648/m.15832 type:complete len:87 (+) Transcript_10648:107-367(+)
MKKHCTQQRQPPTSERDTLTICRKHHHHSAFHNITMSTAIASLYNRLDSKTATSTILICSNVTTNDFQSSVSSPQSELKSAECIYT